MDVFFYAGFSLGPMFEGLVLDTFTNQVIDLLRILDNILDLW